MSARGLYLILNSDLMTTKENEDNRVLLWRIRRVIDDIDDREDKLGIRLSDNEILRIIRLHIRQLKKCLAVCKSEEFCIPTREIRRQLTYLELFLDGEKNHYAHIIISAVFEDMGLSLTEFKYPYILRAALWATRDVLSPEKVVDYINNYYKRNVWKERVSD